MAIPNKATGAGTGSTAQNVFRITFSQALSAVPTLEAWDDLNFNTVAKQIFTGTTVNGSIPMLSAVATTNAAPVSAWKPAGVTVGGATINRMKGNTNYVNLAAAAPGAGDIVRFNLCLEVPSDATVPSVTSLAHVVAVRYQYTGTAPTLTWAFNDGGTEATPVWTTFTSGGAGNSIKYGDAGVAPSNIFVTRPASGVINAAEDWVTA